ncbi:hypothetical protein PV326_002838 [Microctonus aethiopoides]|nr:hypothetical protein PV326_002838 [Microctonus aethiopoides]
MPQDTQSSYKQQTKVRSMSSSAVESPTSEVISLNTPIMSSLEASLNVFITQQTLFNNHLSKVLFKQASSFNDQTNKLNEQNTKTNEQNDKLNEIKNIANSVADHQVKIRKLEQQNDLLSKLLADLAAQNKTLLQEFHQLKNGTKGSPRSPNPLSEIIISGLPAQLLDKPQVIVNKVLSSLDLHQLATGVLEIRRTSTKHDSSSSLRDGRMSK